MNRITKKNTIICTECGKELDVNEVLYNQLHNQLHSELDDEKNKLKEEKINLDKKVIKEVEIRLKDRKKQLEIDRNEVDKKIEELEIKEDKISTIVEK